MAIVLHKIIFYRLQKSIFISRKSVLNPSLCVCRENGFIIHYNNTVNEYTAYISQDVYVKCLQNHRVFLPNADSTNSFNLTGLIKN